MQTSGTFQQLSDGRRKSIQAPGLAPPPRFKTPGGAVGRTPKPPAVRETPASPGHRRGGFADRKRGK